MGVRAWRRAVRRPPKSHWKLRLSRKAECLVLRCVHKLTCVDAAGLFHHCAPTPAYRVACLEIEARREGSQVNHWPDPTQG